MQIADYQNRFGSITELEGAINNMEHKQKFDNKKWKKKKKYWKSRN
jgi:hypothetical protein